MPDPLREQLFAAASTIVVKVGTRVLTSPDGTLNHERIDRLAEEILTLGQQQVGKLAEYVGPDCLELKGTGQPEGDDLVDRYGKVVGPEVHQPFDKRSWRGERKVGPHRCRLAIDIAQRAVKLLDTRDRYEYLRGLILAAEQDIQDGKVVEWTPELHRQWRLEAQERAHEECSLDPDVCP